MSKSPETSTKEIITDATTTGTGVGGGGGKGPNPKRVIEIALLFFILILVAYDTYIISQDHKLLQNLQLSR